MKHQEPVGEEIVLSVLNLGNLLKYWKGEKQKVCSAGHTKIPNGRFKHEKHELIFWGEITTNLEYRKSNTKN